MNRETYTPKQDGIAGFEEYGGVQHGTNYSNQPPVFLNGVRVVGPCTAPGAVAEFLRVKGIRPYVRVERVYDSRRPEGRLDVLSGLPSTMCGPLCVAHGAYVYDHDLAGGATRAPRIPVDDIYNDTDQDFLAETLNYGRAARPL